MASSTQEWIDELKAISVLELSERIKALEEEFGVSAAAVAAAAPAGGGAAAGGDGDGAADSAAGAASSAGAASAVGAAPPPTRPCSAIWPSWRASPPIRPPRLVTRPVSGDATMPTRRP